MKLELNSNLEYTCLLKLKWIIGNRIWYWYWTGILNWNIPKPEQI